MTMRETGDGSTASRSGWSWPRSLFLAMGLGVLVSLTSLNVGLLLDDLLHRLIIAGRLTEYGDWGPLSLYEFVGTARTTPAGLREIGLLPWWTSDQLSVRFFRPLTSALLVLDTWLFGDAPLPAHLHSLMWFLGMLWVVARLHRRLLPAPVAGVATVLWAIAAGHAMPVAWLASRHPLVSGLPGLLALVAHLRAREEDWRPGRVLAPLLLAVSLLGGETAFGVVALLAAYELFGRREGLARAARALAPSAVLMAAYLAFYVAKGFGARGSAAYLDPFGAPGSTMVALLQRVPILLGELVFATPSDAVSAMPALQPDAAVWGALVTLGALALLRAVWATLAEQERHALRWLLPGGLAAVLPGAVGSIGGRVLGVPLLAGSAFVAILLIRSWEAARDTRRPRFRRGALRVAAVVLALNHFLVGPLFRCVLGVGMGQIADAQWSIARQAPPCAGTMVMVAAADPSIATYVPAAMVLLDRPPRRFRLLSSAPHDHVLERTSATGLDLVVRTDARQPGFWEVLHREAPPAAGTEVQLEGLHVTVKEATEAGPMRVHFEFDQPLESPELCFLTWRDGALRPLALPPPGGSVPVPHELGPMRL
jgi:hypothetical protein